MDRFVESAGVSASDTILLTRAAHDYLCERAALCRSYRAALKEILDAHAAIPAAGAGTLLQRAKGRMAAVEARQARINKAMDKARALLTGKLARLGR